MPDKTIIQWQEKEARLADLKPYEKNPRKADKDAYARLKGKIERFGYHGRIICTQDMRVIGGHLRIRALKELGVDPVKVLVAPRPLTEDEYRELLITDNLQDGTWDNDILADAFDDEELLAWGMPDDLLPDREPVAGLTDPDEVPEPGGAPVSVLGDVWLLGDHRIMCGDSTKAEDVARLMDGQKADMVFTDPPYNALKSWKKDEAKSETRLDPRGWFANDNMEWADFYKFIDNSFAHLTGHSVYICCDYRIYPIICKGLVKAGYGLKHCIIWKKNVWGLGKRYRFQHEFIVYACKDKAPFYGDRSQSDVWEVATDKATDHKTPKPVALMRVGLENSSKPGDYVYEPFSGSGTTIIAAEMTGRRCYAMEISPAYVDLAVRRWQNFTGKDATHAETGETFNSRISVPPARKARAKGVAPEQGA